MIQNPCSMEKLPLSRYTWFLLGAIVIFFLPSCGPDLPQAVVSEYDSLPETVDFNYHIRPILADRCWSCHGPDANSREAGLRLDEEQYAFAALENGGHAFVHGSQGRSEALLRMISDDEEKLMPPPESNLELSPREIALIAKWIDQGAEWKKHWAFIQPERARVPEVRNPSWIQYNEIDHFIQRRLEEEELEPAAEAEKVRLLRRVTQDLTGLPPLVDDIDAFLSDESDEAYEQVVDRLLASDAHAERLTMEWLDLARYADSHGMHADGWRLMWPWRDWVISAFKENMPYDQFVTWQMAGDLIESPTRESRIATAFHRNHPMTAEGGVIDEEFRLEYVFDRANTVATAFLGLTMECSRCHDHKFDPISQEEYFQFSSFFNNVRELGMTGDDGNYGPMMILPEESEEEELKRIDSELTKLVSEWKSTRAGLSEIERFLEKVPEQPLVKVDFERRQRRPSSGNQRARTVFDGDSRVYAGADHQLVDGKNGQGIELTGDYDQVNIEIPPFRETDAFSAMAWIHSTKRRPNETQSLFSTAGNKNSFWRGWEFFLDSLNIPGVRIIHSLPHNVIHVSAKDSVSINQWQHLAMSYDGSMTGEGVKIFLNGKEMESQILIDDLTEDIQPVYDGNHKPWDRAVTIGRSGRLYTGEDGFFIGTIDEVRLFDTDLTATEVGVEAGILTLNGAHPEHREDLAKITARRSQEGLNFQEKRAELLQDRISLLKQIPEIMIMEELEEPRVMHVLNRGQYDQPLYPVSPATPVSVLDFSGEYSPDRLGLSQWLFDPENPLTARVAVNRYWQMIFGQGLVSTPHDFGNQGKLPTHPELLDFLALDLIDSGWDIRALLKKMVMSATYRQDSYSLPEERLKDPENLLLARGPSGRMPAEMIRDHGLAASGLLVNRVGGESVRPYQPEGLWLEKSNFSHILLEYEHSEGEDLYRRSMYTFIRRTSPPPFLNIFDAPSRDRCTIQREVTNTPLQALVLLNDPQFLEMARVLAQQVLDDGGETSELLVSAFRRITSREPTETELSVFHNLYSEELSRFEASPESVREYLSVGEYPVSDDVEPARLAALSVVTHTMLNQDEAYMKR